LHISFLYQQLRQVALMVNIYDIGFLTPRPSFQMPVFSVNADFPSDRTLPVNFGKSIKA
jgi:hypothetical protein